MARILEVSNLHKEFTLFLIAGKKIRALEDINFALEEGEIVGLTGKSGAGKSTLMKCVYRTYLPTSGSIRICRSDGTVVNLAEASEHVVLSLRKSEMRYCSQSLQAIPRMPAIEVASEGLLARGHSHDEAFRRTRSCFERLGLPEELWDAYPSTFSGGEQQRVNISRTILSRPRLLLVDEPTASLDLKTKDAVIDMLLELEAAGSSILLITHDEHTLNRLCGRRLHLENGTVRHLVEV